jgi:hypothetical protein
MASASSKKSLDTDYITFRKVFAKLSDNSQVPANYVLASYGNSQTYWASPSTLGLLPTFTEARFDSSSYIATQDSRFLRLVGSNGVLLSTTVSSTTSSLELINTSFQRIDISGFSSLYAYSNFMLDNSLRFATTGFLSSSTIPSQNIITIYSEKEAPALCTNIISYQALKVISSLSSPIDTSPFAGNMIYSKTDASSYPTFAGVDDFVFRTNFSPPTLAIQLSSYTAEAFLGISSLVATSYVSTMSTISSLYTQKDIFSTGVRSLSTTEGIYASTNISTIVELSNYTQLRYNQKFGDTLARATIIQLLDQFGLLNTGLSTVSTYKTPVYIMTSTNKGFIDSLSSPQSISTSTFFNFTAGSIVNFRVNGILAVSTQLSTLSTSIGSNITRMSNGIQSQLIPYLVSSASTFANLGSLGYISSPSLQSTTNNLTRLSYISSGELVSSFSYPLHTYINTNLFISSLTSTTKGLFDNQAIISTLTLQSSLQSTTSGLINEAAYTYVSSAASIVSTTKGIIDYAGSFGYISTATMNSTIISTFTSADLYPLVSTIVSSLTSTINGVSFVSTQALVSSVEGLGNTDYVFITNLQSTVNTFQNYCRSFQSTLTLPNTLFQQQVTMSNLFPGQGYTPASNQYFSSVLFESLSGFDNLIQQAQYVTIEYTPILLFSIFNGMPFYVNSNNMSTGIQIGSNVFADTMFIDKVTFNSFESFPAGSNIYTKKIIMQMKASDFLTAGSNGFSIIHVFENTRSPFFPNNFLTNQTMRVYTPLSNSLFISIYN